jgi:hypothetical protein
MLYTGSFDEMPGLVLSVQGWEAANGVLTPAHRARLHIDYYSRKTRCNARVALLWCDVLSTAAREAGRATSWEVTLISNDWHLPKALMALLWTRDELETRGLRLPVSLETTRPTGAAERTQSPMPGAAARSDAVDVGHAAASEPSDAVDVGHAAASEPSDAVDAGHAAASEPIDKLGLVGLPLTPATADFGEKQALWTRYGGSSLRLVQCLGGSAEHAWQKACGAYPEGFSALRMLWGIGAVTTGCQPACATQGDAQRALLDAIRNGKREEARDLLLQAQHAPSGALVRLLANEVVDAKHGDTALHVAARCCQHGIAHDLVTFFGAWPDRRNSEGKTAADVAGSRSTVDLITLLAVTHA